MSQENVEIVRAAFDAFGRGDIEAVLRLCDESIVITQPPELPDASPEQHGHSGVLEAFSIWPEQWDDYRIEILRTADRGDRVFVTARTRRARQAERGSRWRCRSPSSSRSETRRSSRCGSSCARIRPSKPPGCGSSGALTRPIRTGLRAPWRQLVQFCPDTRAWFPWRDLEQGPDRRAPRRSVRVLVADDRGEFSLCRATRRW